MLPFLRFLTRRLLAIPITLFVVTAALYGIIMLAPPEERAMLYWPPRTPPNQSQRVIENKLNQIIEEHGLRDPFPHQYWRWVSGLARGDWGWSPVLQGPVLEALARRTGVTAELAIYAILLLVPLGFLGGVVSGWRANSSADHRFRAAAFFATSVPPFILGLFLLSIFYVGLRWFPPGRTSIIDISLRTSTFKAYTGLLTVDGLLNGRTDVTVDALRHLVLPVLTLSLVHWATLGRVTRASMIEVKDEDYIVAARSRGLLRRSIVWQHAFRNALLPGLTSTSLSVAALITGVFVIEVIFGFHGLSELIVGGFRGTPDAPLAMGFAVYSVLLILPIMLVLDILKAIVDPRVREGVMDP